MAVKAGDTVIANARNWNRVTKGTPAFVIELRDPDADQCDALLRLQDPQNPRVKSTFRARLSEWSPQGEGEASA